MSGQLIFNHLKNVSTFYGSPCSPPWEGCGVHPPERPPRQGGQSSWMLTLFRSVEKNVCHSSHKICFNNSSIPGVIPTLGGIPPNVGMTLSLEMFLQYSARKMQLNDLFPHFNVFQNVAAEAFFIFCLLAQLML